MRPVPPPVIAVVPAYVRAQRDLDLLLRCLVSLQATAPGTPVLVVDDASPDRALVAALESVAGEVGAAVVSNEENLGFAGTVNVGLELARAEGVDALLVNADIEFAFPGWLEAMHARRDTQGRPAAVVGARLLFASRLLQHAGIYYSRLHRDFFHRFRYGPADLPEALEPTRCPVTAALQLIRHDTLAAVGLYDPAFGMAYEDVDFCLRVFAAGGECVYEPAAVALHLEKAFRDRPTARIQALHERSVKHLWDKHGETDLSAWTPAVR
jgi:GT2 family glycosyltransferase